MPRISFSAADGTVLEGRLTLPDQPPHGAAVLCHPHPQAGGSMDSWMMPVLQRALVGDGWVGLRFNFRGVGRSEGSHGGGQAELADVAGAVERVIDETGAETCLMLVGWSFGAHVALRSALDDERVDGWVGVGLLADDGDFELPPLAVDRLGEWRARKLFLHGSRDQFTSLDQLRPIVEAAAQPKDLHVVDGGDHFLAEHGDVLAAEVRRFGRVLLGGE